MRFGCCCFFGGRVRSVGVQDWERVVKFKLWNTRRRETVERLRRWRSEPSLPDSLVEHDEWSSDRPSRAVSPDILSLLLELPIESASVPRLEIRLLRAFSRRPPRGVEIVSFMSSIGGQTTIFGVIDGRRVFVLLSRCSSTAFTGRSPENSSRVIKLTANLFFIWSLGL